MGNVPKIDPKFILSLPESVLQTIPGGTPPPGVQALSPHPATLRPQTIAVGSVFLVIASIFFAIRIYVKTSIIRKFTLDDYVCTAAFFAGIMLAETQGAGGRHMWDSTVAELLSYPNALANWITTVFITPALGLAKLTFLIQYYQLFWPLRWVRVSCWSVGSVLELYYLAVTITMFIICSPWPGQSWKELLLTPHYLESNDTSIPTGAIGAAFDIFLLVLPIRAISTLQLAPRKKIGLMLVFLTGAIASVASILGLVYRIKNTNNLADAEWIVSEVWIWMQVELFTGIACSCMPSFSKLLSHHGGAAFTPRRIAGYFRGHHSKLSDEAKESAYTSNSSNDRRSQQKKTSTTRFQLNEISGGQGSPGAVEGNPEGGIHLVHEVSVYNEEMPDRELDRIEHGIVDRRW